jgi:hypothetical protein
MSPELMSLAVQVITGAIGGNAAGASLKNIDLGKLGNTITGAVGGGVAGQMLQAFIPALTTYAQSHGAETGDIGALITQVIGGGAGGAILTVIVGFLKNLVSGNKS